VLAYNVRSQMAVFLKPPPWGADYAGVDSVTSPRDVSDADGARLATWFERSWGMPIRSEVAHKAFDVAARQAEYDPVKQYLEGLVWDGELRLDWWLVRYLGAADTPLARAIGANWMTAAVARACEPGCIADNMLVLVGEQGQGKSRALRGLTGEGWFTDELPTPGDKDAAIQLQGVWIIEFSELEVLNRAELSALKAFITRRTDRYRPPFGRTAIDHPRRCVIAGSTNEDSFLRDSTGNRRFWPVACGVSCKPDVVALVADRDQLWAEAVRRYRSGATWHLDDAALVRDAREIQEHYYQRDAWEDLVQAYVRQHKPGSLTTGDVLTEVIHQPEGRWSHGDQSRVGKILRRLGWTKKRIREGALRGWRYFPPFNPKIGQVGQMPFDHIYRGHAQPAQPVQPPTDGGVENVPDTQEDGGSGSGGQAGPVRQPVEDAAPAAGHPAGSAAGPGAASESPGGEDGGTHPASASDPAGVSPRSEQE
jgi:predicted P-loop ATPase